jgi:kynureninase
VELVEEAGIAAIRAKAATLTELAVERIPPGFELGSPRDPARRGAHVSLRHADAWRICRALIERARVIPDFRGPDSIRFGFSPLYTRFADVEEALARLAALDYADVDPGARRVT